MGDVLEGFGDTVTVLAGIGVVVGVVGTIVPVLPGGLLVAASVLVWALVTGGTAWWVLLAVVVVLSAGQVLEYLTAGVSLKRAGVPTRSLVIGGLAGIVGFFVVPVLGLVLGFLGGLYAAERARQPDAAAAWRSTRTGLRAAGVALLIELAAVLVSATLWFSAVLWWVP
ncbi:DUF456 domain-containing protein [uncultured Pseudokineococcus sp.]|uniref:DUF456 domain-containing protein n=1 Tax=uncultured Pseudokineococcus sp. TaxID=1642928 RepID=UPI0026075324|nr:DUF456 domain-containing protein [uncultured Pseudokineococcus sp.]